MARVPTIDPAEFPSELAAVLGNPGSDQRVALGALPAWAVRPDLAVAMVTFQRALDAHALLPARLLELVRLRVAFHNRCRSCMAVRSARAIADGMTDVSSAASSVRRKQTTSPMRRRPHSTMPT